MAYSVALDPNVKVAYAQQKWDKNSFDIGLESLKQVFDDYYVPPVSVSASEVDMGQLEVPSTRQVQYGRSWVLAAVQAHQASDRTQLNPRAELTTYLKSPLEQTEDVCFAP
ncbi:hypothetical protein M405DRAFT_863611 [Rhizopogon salebrosus TDB-379]|nr:hypothetical protein M405DRAFT_863611 [Rhizopogon salebrosus TDB-379]